MLRSLKTLYGEKLGACDGDVGLVQDFYFDDQKWVIRYVVADTGSWLHDRLVLISPHAFGDFYQAGDYLLINLTRQQIEHCPPIETHKPVSRHYEEEYYRYYGWPSYWGGNEMWGVGGLPTVPQTSFLPAVMPSRGSHAHDEDDDPHLRSFMALKGYHIANAGGVLGHVTDLIFDDQSWEIRHVIAETGHWYSGKEIAISPKSIDRISYEDSTVFVQATNETIMGAPEYHVPALDASYHDSRNFDA